MKNIINNIKAFIADEKGAETVEWVMIVAILAAIIIVVFNTNLGTTLIAAMGKITANITTAAH